MYIHAFDPGETTGHCILHCATGTIEVICSGEIVDYDVFEDVAGAFRAKPLEPHIVVIEAWRLYPHKAQSQIGSYMPAAEKIGIIKYLCWQHGTDWIEQMASCKQAFSRPEVMAQVLPGYVLPSSEHEKDALRHALYYWFNTGRHQ